jgi:hypothetical protein
MSPIARVGGGARPNRPSSSLCTRSAGSQGMWVFNPSRPAPRRCGGPDRRASSFRRSRLCRWARHEWNAERRRLPTAGRRRGTVVARRRVVVAWRGVLRCPLWRGRGAAPIVVVAVVVVTMIVIMANILIPVRSPAWVVILAGAPVVVRHETGFGLRGACGQPDARRTGQ